MSMRMLMGFNAQNGAENSAENGAQNGVTKWCKSHVSHISHVSHVSHVSLPRVRHTEKSPPSPFPLHKHPCLEIAQRTRSL